MKPIPPQLHIVRMNAEFLISRADTIQMIHGEFLFFNWSLTSLQGRNSEHCRVLASIF